MRSWKALAAMACALMLIISGCSKNDDGDKKMESNANATDTKKPQNDAANTVNETMDNMMTYFKDQGLTLDDMKDLTDMDFAAHEGRSFSYQGNTAYLYRLKENDESMKALLDSAKNTGTVKVNINGEKKDYAASVNGNYLLVYLKDAKMDDLLKQFDSYKAGIGGIKNSDSSNSATDNNDGVNGDQSNGNTGTNGNPTKSNQNNADDEAMD